MYYCELRSYPIPAVKGMLRHYYWNIREENNLHQIEIHSGMDTTVVPSETYGRGRTEEEKVLCEYCKQKLIFDTYRKNKLFNIFFWNCDVISGHCHQTIIMWLIGIFTIASLFAIENLYVSAFLSILLLMFNSPGLININPKIPRTYCVHLEQYGMGRSVLWNDAN